HTNRQISYRLWHKPRCRAVAQTFFNYIDWRVAHATNKNIRWTFFVGHCLPHGIKPDDFPLIRCEVAWQTPRASDVFVEKLLPARGRNPRQLILIVIGGDSSPREVD